MAVTTCINGHRMWNGDGKPVIWAFKISDLRQYVEKYPERYNDNTSNSDDYKDLMLFDMIDDIDGENLDCWYCDECKSLAVFFENKRYDYVLIEPVPTATYSDILDWEGYIAFRDWDFVDFSESNSGNNPLEAIYKYDFKYFYRVSPDKKLIYVFDRNDTLAFAYEKVRTLVFDKE